MSGLRKVEETKMSEIKERQHVDEDPGRVLHWYDYLCPFCYVGQHRTEILVRHGLRVVELPFQAHPAIPDGGISAGPRNGPMYAMLEREAREAGLPLRWPSHLPNTRLALAAAEWVRRHQPRTFARLHKGLFEAQFVLGEDLEDPAVIDRHAEGSGVDLWPLHAALADGSAARAVTEAETAGHEYGVQGTPAWLVAQQLIMGLQPAAEIERVAARAANSKHHRTEGAYAKDSHIAPGQQHDRSTCDDPPPRRPGL
jgi:predicted DsbA family dithiol-disulfide isomerase